MAKRTIFYLLALLLASCQQIDLSQDRGQLTVNCRFNQSQSSLDETRSTIVPVSDVATRIEYIIFQDGALIAKSEQIKADDAEGFGTFNTDLAPGTYTVVVFAHNSTGSVSVSPTGLITAPSDRPTDSFSATAQITISKDERTSANLQLSRCVARLVIDSNDEVPSTVNRMSLTLEGVSTTFDALSQSGYVSDPVVKEVNDISYVTDTDTHHFHIGTYLFLPQLITTSDATLRFMHYDETTGKTDTLYKSTLPLVQLRVNAETTATATLFTTPGTDIQLTVDKDWYSPIIQNF